MMINKQDMTLFKQFYYLTKPGIIYGNITTATGGFLLAARGHVDLWLLIALLSGTSLVIASACVFNNYIDRGIDKKMARTKKRAIASGLIPGKTALIYATTLGLLGFLILSLYTNLLTVMIGVVGFLDYVVLYGLSKRRWTAGTVVGSISGATPVVAGYTAVTNRFDGGALLLFLSLIFWQMPHFYAIAMRRFDDYKAAGLPVLPVKKGMLATKIQILFYIVAFIITTSLLTVFSYTGFSYLIIVSAIGLAWLWIAVEGFKAPSDKLWARKMFLFSLIVIMTFSVLLSANSLLP